MFSTTTSGESEISVPLGLTETEKVCVTDRLPSLAFTVAIALPSPTGVNLTLDALVLCACTTLSSLDVTVYVSVSPSRS